MKTEKKVSLPPDTPRPDHGQAWRPVAVVLVGAFMALLDTTIVTVALPTIRTGLHASPAALEWVVSAYALAYGLTLIPAGRAGDRFGHKPLFLIGLTIFTLASAACGLAQSQGEIIAARAVQGSGAGIFCAAIEGVQRPRRHDRRVHRARAGAWRPDHRGRGGPRRLALGVPGEPVHRRGRVAGGGPTASPRAIAYPSPVRPGRVVPAVRRVAPAPHPAGGR